MSSTIEGDKAVGNMSNEWQLSLVLCREVISGKTITFAIQALTFSWQE